MADSIEKVQKGLSNLKALEESPATLPQRQKILRQLMIDLCEFENIPPCLEISKKECILAREVYEYATFMSVEKKDIEEFERNIGVLKSYYEEFDGVIPKSQKKNAVLGLYLLYLLSYNKISEYHTEIELIPFEEIESNIYIKVPVSLENYFVQGSYQNILRQQQNVPLPAYYFFIEKFVDAIRYEIARSAEQSYDSLKLSDMQKMFMIETREQLMAFISQNQQKAQSESAAKDRVNWEVRNDRLFFLRAKKEVEEIPSLQMINLSLDYATELNRII